MFTTRAIFDGRGPYYERMARGPADYYAEQVSQSRYVGGGAAALGLSGNVDAEALEHILDLRLPDGSGPLGADLPAENRVRKSDGHRYRTRLAQDLALSAPRTVGVLHALGNERVRAQVLESELCACEATFRRVEQLVCARTGHAGAHREPVKLLGMAFAESVSRAGQPNPHVHIVTSARGLSRGVWRAVEFREVYRHQHELDLIYKTVLADELKRRLGVTVTWRGQSFEIDGIPRGLVEELTGARRRDILATGARTAREREVAALRTRGKKSAVPPFESLRASWREVARKHDFAIESVLGRGKKERGRVRAAQPMAVPARYREQARSSRPGGPIDEKQLSNLLWRAEGSSLRAKRSVAARSVRPAPKMGRAGETATPRRSRLWPRPAQFLRGLLSRRREVHVSPNPWKLARATGTHAYTPRAFLLRTKPLTHRATFRVLRGGSVEEPVVRPSLMRSLASERGGRIAPLAPARGRVPQFRSLWAFLRYAEQVKRRGVLRLDKKTTVVIHDPEKLDAAELNAVRDAARLSGSRVTIERSEPSVQRERGRAPDSRKEARIPPPAPERRR